MVRVLSCAVIATLLLSAGEAYARTDTKVESSRPVTSEDGKRTVVVDRLTPIVDGEPERFSGRMLVRVTNADGSAAKQRYIEASQVRVVQPPVWLDGSRVCAFVYNVAKNSNGIVYFEPDTNRALQVEFVMPARHMAATGRIEQELTSLEVTEFSRETLKIRNVPWKGGSAFPLVLDALPMFQGGPYDVKFLNSLNASIASYKEWMSKNGLEALEPEQASESFSKDNTWLGLLACAGGNAYVMGVPLRQGQPADLLNQVKFAKISGVDLSCAQHNASETDEQPVSDNRFLTNWLDATHLQVIKESYDAESDAAKITPLSVLDTQSGQLNDKGTTGSK